MSVVLLRLDERLIHGQVTVGWAGHLHPDRVVVVDDELSASAWEQELYTIGLPSGIEALFVSVEAGRARLSGWREDGHRSIVLVRDVDTLDRLLERGAGAGMEVNVGGVHHAEGRRPVLPYVFLTDDELGSLRRLEKEEEVRVSAQDVPSAARISIEQLEPR
jgi:mannose/fructose/N-acetylgalactosamine-specific phosphotransferase system component IIB